MPAPPFIWRFDAPMRAPLLSLLALAALSAPLPLDGIFRPVVGAAGAEAAYILPPRGGNHAASLALLPGGALVSAWFTGGEGTPNCSIAVSRLGAGAGAAWSPGAVAVTVPGLSAQNPVLWQDVRLGALRLWHTVASPSGGESTSSIYEARSLDGGASWGASAPFYAVPGAFTRNAPLALPPHGRLLLPIYNSTPGAIPDYPIYLHEEADGSWRATRAPGADLIQPTVIARGGGAPGGPARLRAWLRDENQSCAWLSDSEDGGERWSEPARTALQNNNAALAALALRSGAVAVVYDDEAGSGTPRSPLVIALSDDGGETFPVKRALQVHDDNATTTVGEYSYPAIVQEEQGRIVVAYTVDRLAIKVVRFDEAWVRGGNQRGHEE